MSDEKLIKLDFPDLGKPESAEAEEIKSEPEVICNQGPPFVVPSVYQIKQNFESPNAPPVMQLTQCLYMRPKKGTGAQACGQFKPRSATSREVCGECKHGIPVKE